MPLAEEFEKPTVQTFLFNQLGPGGIHECEVMT